MAKVRIPINPLQVGKVGAYSMYVRKGEQVVRQRKNSSNYGEEASRSLPQQTRRVRWSNLVNFYKASSFWMAKSFENIKDNQTVYNRFMQLNIDRFKVALTKERAAQGWSIVDAFKVSDGSLSPCRFITTSDPDAEDERLNLQIHTDITLQSTVGDLAAAVIEENYGWQDGDNLAIVLFEQLYVVGEFPKVQPYYYEITMDKASTLPLSQVPIFAEEMMEISGMYMQIPHRDRAHISYAGLVAIHTRKSGGLKVSSQEIKMVNTTYVDDLSTQAALDAAIASYGLDADVMLAPSFNPAVIASVTFNGGVISSGQAFDVAVEQGGELVIMGKYLTSQSVQLLHTDSSGVSVYVPLSVSGSSWTFILGMDGVNELVVNGARLGRVRVSGVVAPDFLPGNMFGFYAESTSVSGGESSGRDWLLVHGAFCLNYPYKPSETYPYMVFGLAGSKDTSLFAGFNCTINSVSNPPTTSTRVNVSVIDASKPAYITYDGFIVCVFNY